MPTKIMAKTPRNPKATPAAASDLPPVPTGIQNLLRLASVDRQFRKQLVERRDGLAAVAGVELSASERVILRQVAASQLEAMIDNLPSPPADRREFLRQTAASTVLLLGGAAFGTSLPGCESAPKRPSTQAPVLGIRPDPEDLNDEPPDGPTDPPPERPDQLGAPRGIAPDLPPDNSQDAGAIEKPIRHEHLTKGHRADLPPKRPPKKK